MSRAYQIARATRPRSRLPALLGGVSKPAAFEVVEAEVVDVVSIVLVCWVVDVFVEVEVEVEVLVELDSVKKIVSYISTRDPTIKS